MASVKVTRASKYARRGMVEDEPPDSLETAGNLMIKELVKKQTKTDLTLQQQLQEERKFEPGVGVIPLSEFSAGTSSLADFEKKCEQAERADELERRGFSRTDAFSLLTKDRQSKAEPSAQAAIQKLLNDYQESSGPSHINYEPGRRQDLELALSEKPESLETRLYRFAMKNRESQLSADPRPPGHPIHHLVALEQDLVQTADPCRLARTLRRKRRQLVEAQAEPPTVHYKPPDVHSSLWDAIEKPVKLSKHCVKLKPLASCRKQTLYTIRDGKIVNFSECTKSTGQPENEFGCKSSGQAFVTLQVPRESTAILDRLSEEMIRLLPRFQNYEKGAESKTLFIKNLHRSVAEADLIALFGRFQDSSENKIVYRLMTGKMRGQAFVTFSSVNKATEALDALNGTVIKDKPMIIQYGKSQDL